MQKRLVNAEFNARSYIRCTTLCFLIDTVQMKPERNLNRHPRPRSKAWRGRFPDMFDTPGRWVRSDIPPIEIYAANKRSNKFPAHQRGGSM